MQYAPLTYTAYFKYHCRPDCDSCRESSSWGSTPGIYLGHYTDAEAPAGAAGCVHWPKLWSPGILIRLCFQYLAGLGFCRNIHGNSSCLFLGVHTKTPTKLAKQISIMVSLRGKSVWGQHPLVSCLMSVEYFSVLSISTYIYVDGAYYIRSMEETHVCTKCAVSAWIVIWTNTVKVAKATAFQDVEFREFWKPWDPLYTLDKTCHLPEEYMLCF